MFIKLSIALVGALAVAAQAALQYGGQGKHYGHEKYHSIKSTDGYGNQTSVSSSLGNSPTQASSVPTESTSTPVYGSSSVPGGSVVPTIPLSTGGPSIPLISGATGTGGNSPIQTGDHTLTYTLGSGSSTTVITTTIKETSTQTNISTVYATSGSGAAATGGSGGGDEPTTTITSTLTSTQYKTIVPVSSGVGNSPVGASGSGNSSGGASGSGNSSGASSGSGNCPAQATVTVTGSPVVSPAPYNTVHHFVVAYNVKW